MTKHNNVVLPNWFEFPEKYIKLLKEGDFEKGEYDFGPSWQLLRMEKISLRSEGLKKHYPDRNLYPFARRVCEDDLACFDLAEQASPPKVIIIHDFASPGWEYRGSFDDFESWLEHAKNEEEI